jgi:hypothetical protein
LADTNVLIITIPTRAHEVLHRDLDDQISFMVGDMGLRRDFTSVGSSTYTELDADNQVMSGGEGDSCRIPSSREHADDFPTLVIEAGYTQSWSSLKDKARWWFRASRYDVKIILLVKMNRSSGQIIIEKWKGMPAPRPGATTWSQAQQLLPTRVDSIRITQVPGTNPATYNVTGPLRLEFVDLFLRQPVEARGEDDVVLSIEDLQEYADAVWTRT